MANRCLFINLKELIMINILYIACCSISRWIGAGVCDETISVNIVMSKL